MISDIAAGNISIKYGFKGPNYAVVSACATGSHAIGNAFKMIKYGDADVVLAGGSEAGISPLSIAGFSNMMLKSTNVNHQLPQINGEIIKAVIQSFEENELDPTFTMELEITNLLIEPLNMEDFIVPQQYTITNK